MRGKEADVGTFARYGLALLILIFGVFSCDTSTLKWMVLALSLYSLPLLGQWSRFPLVRVSSLWLGVFLVAQTLLSSYLANPAYVRLRPNYQRRFHVQGDTLRGIHGIQVTTTDEKGHRVSSKINYETKPPGTYRIFVLGGSTTALMLLDDTRTWAHLLFEKLQRQGRSTRFEAINTGLDGTRARNHLATLRRIREWEPDMAIVMLGINDWNRQVIQEFSPPPLSINPRDFRRTLLGGLIWKGWWALSGGPVEVSNAAGAGTREPEMETGTYYSGQQNSLARSVRHSFKPTAVASWYGRQLDHMAKICRSSDMACVFVTQPTGYRKGASEEYKASFWMTPPNQDYTLDFESLVHLASLYNDYLVEFGRRNEVNVCDIAVGVAPSFANFYDDCHYNLHGSEVAAGLLFDCITSRVSLKLGK